MNSPLESELNFIRRCRTSVVTTPPDWRLDLKFLKRLCCIAPTLLAACAGAASVPAPVAAGPTFDPIAFFSGQTEGSGRLHIVLSHPRAVHVHGQGTVTADGALRLVQEVDEEGKPASRREWVIRTIAPGRYAASLSDARGPVMVEVAGDRLHLRFHMAHGLAAEQWLLLAPGGQAARNRMIVRKLGIVVARLDEKIVRRP